MKSDIYSNIRYPKIQYLFEYFIAHDGGKYFSKLSIIVQILQSYNE